MLELLEKLITSINNSQVKKLGAAVTIAGIIMLVCTTGLCYRIDRYWRDVMIETRRDTREDVVVIGIDAYSLSEVGEWPWDRSIMAEIIDIINEDPEARPAAIGLDLLYAADTTKEADLALAEAAGRYGNVVTACAAEYGSEVVIDTDGSYYLDEFVAEYPTMPYEALEECTTLGHINAMFDRDGILRRHLWEVRLKDGRVLPSMPEELYKKFCSYHGLEADFEPYVNNRGFWWVDYSGNPGDYFAYSAVDILNREFDPEVLAGSVVIIGPYESAMQDNFITAADHAKYMYGSEYIANVTANMMNGNAKREISEVLQLIAVFLYGAVIIYFFLDSKMQNILIGYAITFTASAVGDRVLYYVFGIVTHSFWFFSTLVVSYVCCLIVRYNEIQIERRLVTNTFERYVDPVIMKELLRHGSNVLDMRGQTMTIAVLFVDIRGFTRISAKMDAQEVVTILNEYLTLTTRCVKKFGGTVDKYIGDCTMAFWGAPLTCEDAAYKACQAAVEMKEEAGKLLNRFKEEYGEEIDIGIGIHYGDAVVGNVGSKERMDFTAIGDTVNTASRLESIAPAGTIYISRSVMEELDGRATLIPLEEETVLKGKTNKMKIWKLEQI